MNDSTLDNLLRDAGRSAASPPGSTGDLADRVRRLHRRRQRRRRVGGGLSVVVLLAAATWPVQFYHADVESGQPVQLIGEHNQPETESLEAEVARLKAEVVQLRAAAEQQEAALRDVLARQEAEKRLAAWRRERAKPDPAIIARGEMEKTAFLLVDWADGRRAQGANLDELAAAYRQVDELFPDTPSGGTARQRLDTLTGKKGTP